MVYCITLVMGPLKIFCHTAPQGFNQALVINHGFIIMLV